MATRILATQRSSLTVCCRRGCRRAVAAKVCAPSASTSIPTKDVQSLLQEERKTVTQQLRDRGKIVGKLSKKVAKAKLAESPALMADLSTAMQALNETRCELDDMLTRMSAAGCVDACSSSSSSDCGDTKQAKPRAVTAADGVPTLLAQTSGTMSVCEGKACRRSAADEVYGLLHARAASNGVAVQRCKCLDQCKMGPNVKVEQPGTETIIVKGVTVECVPAEAEKEREAVLA